MSTRILCVAGAGSGKTRKLVSTALKLMDNMPSRRLAIMTFTRKAAQEIRRRIDRDTNAFIGTFHAFGLRILRKHGMLMGYNSQSITVMPDTEREVLLGLAKSRTRCKEGVSAVEEAFHQYGITGEAEFDNRHIERMFWDYMSLCICANIIDTDFILPFTLRIIKEYENVQSFCHETWTHFLIDEAHDSNIVQWEIVKAIDPEYVFAVYDPRQTIYQWNGSRPDLVEKYLNE